MNQPLLIAMPGNDGLVAGLAAALAAEIGCLTVRPFPDEETYLRFDTGVAFRSVALLCTLAHPDAQVLRLLLAAAAARDLGAAEIGLIAPYLAYMRQDRRFMPGEAVTSQAFAALLSNQFDWIVTVEPHLHRHGSLREVFHIPAYVAHAGSVIADWLGHETRRPLLVGPDSESEQWVAAVARAADAPHVILQKTRRGDRDVEVALPDMTPWQGFTPIVIDDIVSSGQTMIETIRKLRQAAMLPPVCIAVHGIFAGFAYEEMIAAGASRIICSNTVPHPSNAIDVTQVLAEQVRLALARREARPGASP